jgi:predicted anti-sigma-YlaC factor YlaD
MKTIVDCKLMSRLLSGAPDGKLPAADEESGRLHLVACTACRTVEQQVKFLRRAAPCWPWPAMTNGQGADAGV